MKAFTFFISKHYGLVLAGISLALTAPAQPAAPAQRQAVTTRAAQEAMAPRQAWQRLAEGNLRFVKGNTLRRNYSLQRKLTAAGQFPFAVVLSCIDSRTSSELVFDQGLGDIFNVRIAGNIADSATIACIEFACKFAGAKLIVVEGHTGCGAIRAACDQVREGYVGYLTKKIQPAIDSCILLTGPHNASDKSFLAAVTRKNIEIVINEIRSKSTVIAALEKQGRLIIAGALYDLESGKVSFFGQQ